MLIFTPELFAKIKAVIRKYHTAFVVSVFGKDVVSEDELKALPPGLVPPGPKQPDEAYLLGQVLALTESPKVQRMTRDELVEHVQKNPVPLTAQEQTAARAARFTAAQYCMGLGNTIEKDTGQLLIEADQKLRSDLAGKIKEATAANIEKRETVKQLKTDLGWATQDWTRNLDRISITEKHNAMQQGVSDGVAKKHGDNARVFLRAQPGCCPKCDALTRGSDGAPRIFRLSDLPGPGANVGKKQAAWTACVGSIHPHCRCQMSRVPTGWGFDEEGKLAPGGKFGIEQTEKSMRKAMSVPTLNDTTYVIPDAVGGVVLESDPGLVTGTGSNLQVGAPARPIGGANDVVGYRAYLTSGQPRTSVIRRDPRIYEFDADTVDWRVPIDLNQGVMATSHDGLQALETDNVARQMLQVTLVPRNTTNPGANPLGSLRLQDMSEREDVQVVREGEPDTFHIPTGEDDEEDLAKAGPYIGPQGGLWADPKHTIHWSQEAAKWTAARGGHVSEHHASSDHKILKVPHANAKDLHDFKAKHGIGGQVFQGKHHAMLIASHAELHGAFPTPVEAPKPAPVAPPQAPAPVAPPKPPKPAAPPPSASKHADLKAFDATTVTPNPKGKWIISSGTAVTVNGKPGIIKGWSRIGKAVCEVDGKRVVTTFDNVSRSQAGEPPKQVDPLQKLKPETCFQPTELQRKAVDAALSMDLPAAAKGHKPKDYANWLLDRGHDVYLVGGIVRDLVAMTDPKGKVASMPELKNAMNDVDFVVSAPPIVLKAAHDAIAPGTAGFYDATTSKGAVPCSSTGIDLNSLSSGGVYDKATAANDYEVPSTFDHDLETDAARRDFTCNALYYDVRNNVVVDPAGTGIDDTRNKVLRRLPGKEWEKNDKIAVRFWKLRARGWTGEKETTAWMVKIAAKEFGDQNASERANNIAKQIAKNSKSASDCLEQFRAAMVADGAGHIYEQYIAPVKSQILAGVKKHQGKH